MTTNVCLQEVGHILTCWSFICKWHNVIIQDKRPNQEALQTAEQTFVHVFILYFADPESCACLRLCGGVHVFLRERDYMTVKAFKLPLIYRYQ